MLNRAFLQFVDPDDPSELKPISGDRVAKVLRTSGVEAVLLNACESASQSRGMPSNIAALFVHVGIATVIGMSYKLLVNAADVFVGEFYRAIRHVSVSQAVLYARWMLAGRRDRMARFRKVVSVEDWIVPVIYQNEGCLEVLQPDVMLGLFSVAIDNCIKQPVSVDETRSTTSSPHQSKLGWHSSTIVGRNFDLAVLESKLLLQSNVLELRGEIGIGKSGFVSHVASWWKRTKFVDSIAIVDLEACIAPNAGDPFEAIVGKLLTSISDQSPLPNDKQQTNNEDELDIPIHDLSIEGKRHKLVSRVAATRCLIILDHLDAVEEKLSKSLKEELKVLILDLAQSQDESRPERFVLLVSNLTDPGLGRVISISRSYCE